MAFMLMERNSGNSTIDYPIEGSKGIVDALVRGIEKYGGRVLLRARVQEVLVEGEYMLRCALRHAEKICNGVGPYSLKLKPQGLHPGIRAELSTEFLEACSCFRGGLCVGSVLPVHVFGRCFSCAHS